MINFFRNARRRLIGRESLITYLKYALGEIILVVLGILIALQINNNVEYQKDRRLENIYLKELLSEIQNDTATISYLFKSLEESGSKAKLVLDFLQTSSLIKSDTLLTINYFRDTYKFYVSKTSTNTWDELKSTGNLRLIENRDLVKMLSEYYQTQFNLFGISANEIRSDIEFAHQLDKMIFSVADHDDYFNDFKQDKLKDTNTIQRLLAHPKSVEAMKRLLISHRVFSINLKYLQNRALFLIDRLKEETQGDI